MVQLFNLVWSGIGLGCAYGFIAIGLVATFRAGRVVNVSVGGTFVFAGLLMAWLITRGWSVAYAVILSIIAATVVSVAQERFVLRRIVGASPKILLLGTLAVAIVLSGVCGVWFGRDPITAPGLGGSIRFDFGFWHTSLDALLLVGAGLALTLGGWITLERTITGQAVTAVGADPGAAQMLGVNVWRLRHMAAAFTGVSAGVGGTLFVPLGVLDFNQGLSFTLYGFVAAAVAGYQSLWWTFLASIGFGIISELGTSYISSVFSQAVAFGILAVAVLVGQRVSSLRALG